MSLGETMKKFEKNIQVYSGLEFRTELTTAHPKITNKIKTKQ